MILYTLYVKERALRKDSIYAIVSQLPDDGQKIGQYMSYCKIRKKAILVVVLFNIQLTLYMKWDVNERQL